MSDGPDPVRSPAQRLALAGEDPPEPPRCPCLVVIQGEEVGRRIDLALGTVTIGSSDANGICLAHDGISPSHATIVSDAHGVVIRDHGSSSGTYVNGKRIEDAELHGGDAVGLGSIVLRLLVGDEVEILYREEIRRLSTLDGLTQVSNRRYFIDQLEREIRDSRERGEPLSLVMVGIDDLRTCNEVLGHRAGDEVLRRLADSIRRNARDLDVVARWGGGAFAILMRRTDLADAAAFGETIRKLVEADRYLFDERRIPVATSVGVVQLEASDAGADGLVQRALARLADASEGGGNRVAH